MSRGLLVPDHWLETRYALRRVVEDVCRSRSAGGGRWRRGVGSRPLVAEAASGKPARDYGGAVAVLPPARAVSQAALEEEPRALLARVHELLAATAHEEATLRDQIASAAAARRQQLPCCAASPAALCKRSLGKSQAIVRWHLQAAALDVLTVLGGLLLLLSYRGPSLVRSLRGVRSWPSVTLRVTHQKKEMLLDAVLALEALLITVTLYQAP